MRAILIAAGLVASTINAAHAQDGDEERKFIVAQFQGWSGIMLRCALNTTNKAAADSLCQSASAEFNYLAENSEIPHVVSRDENPFQMYMTAGKIGKPLILELETTATVGNASLSAIHVRLAARSFYSTAIEADAKPGDPEASPRGGDLVLWETSTIAAGYGEQQVARDLSPYVNDNMKVFFAQFLKGWRSK